MEAIILAAGRGSRLSTVTTFKPKCLVTVAGRPILDYQLSAYEKAGVDRITVIVGYRADDVRAWLQGRTNDAKVEVVENLEFANTNNMFSLHLASERVRGRSFFLSNGDVVIEEGLIARMSNAPPQQSLIAVDKSRYLDESMKIEATAAGRVTRISKAVPAQRSAGCSIDVYRFTAATSESLFKEIGRRLNRGDRHEWTEVAIDALVAQEDHDIVVFPLSNERWVEIDNLADLSEADTTFSKVSLEVSKVDCVVFDVDGTIALDGKPLPGAKELVRRLRTIGKRVVFCTNNSSRRRSEFFALLSDCGFEPSNAEIMTSTDLTIEYLKKRPSKNIGVLGTDGLKGDLSEAGFDISLDCPEVIVVGFDKSLTFETLSWATCKIAQGIPFLVTHGDVACPTAKGPIPDAGAIAALLTSATGALPEAVLGKPSPQFVKAILQSTPTLAGRVLIVGDRLDTDIAMAQQTGCQSILVLSGATSRSQVEVSPIRANMIISGVDALLEMITTACEAPQGR